MFPSLKQSASQQPLTAVGLVLSFSLELRKNLPKRTDRAIASEDSNDKKLLTSISDMIELIKLRDQTTLQPLRFNPISVIEGPSAAEVGLATVVMTMIDLDFDKVIFTRIPISLEKIKTRAGSQSDLDRKNVEAEVSRLYAELDELPEYRRYLSYEKSWFKRFFS